MKPYDKDIDIVFSPMSDETMSWLDELLTKEPSGTVHVPRGSFL